MAKMTKESEDALLHLLVARLGGHSVDLLPLDGFGRLVADKPWRRGFSVGRNRSVALDEIAALFAEAATPVATGCYDRDGRPLYLGDRVVYHLEGPHTKREYWNPEYVIVWDAPMFTLKHVGGGLPGDNYLFKLKHGGQNGNLELIARGEHAAADEAARVAVEGAPK